jgi:vacuolar-type H+-ATPase subunit I/STV1
MPNDPTLDTLERTAYRASYSDGIIDVFVGLSLIWIGVAWIWLPDFAGLAGVLPAIFVTPLLTVRRQTVEKRAGYVKWTAPRRNWERRNLLAALLGGVVLLLMGVGVFVAVNGSGSIDITDAIGPGLLAFLLALLAVVLAFLMDAPRMFAYAAALVMAGAIASAADANPGWPLLAAGAVVAIVGSVMLARFLNANPVVEAA